MKWNDYVLGDAFEGLAEIREASVDLVFTSLPDLSQTEWDAKSTDQYQGFQTRALAAISRIVKPSGFVVLCQTDRKVNAEVLCNHYWYMKTMFGFGWKLKDEKIVVRNEVGLRDLYHFTYQYMSIFTQEGTFKRAGEWLRDIIVDQQEKTVPGQYTWSQDFCRMVIEALCPVGGKVVDPFAAAGPVLFAAYSVDRSYWGAEICPERYNKDFHLFVDRLEV